jgi:glycosyltransferase involved in cell wall biosynthesis
MTGTGEPLKVSVVSITYNQQAFIRETLDGFVAQKTDFPLEVIVADDASTDATPAIIQEYADRHPDLFRPILRPENIGVLANFVETLSAARGEYIALCEGDDYWTDPLKLTKQVEFLDEHPETTVCFHPVRVVYDDGTKDEEFPPNSWRRDLSVEALLRRNFIQTNSVVYRRLPRYDDIPPGIMPIDWYLHVRHAIQGGIAMLPETMAVYRRHAQGIWYAERHDRQRFWQARGRGLAATLEAMLDLFPGDPEREGIVGAVSDGILGQIATLPTAEGRAVLVDTIAAHPRMASLALRHRWAQSPRQQLKHALIGELSGWVARAANFSARLRRRP